MLKRLDTDYINRHNQSYIKEKNLAIKEGITKSIYDRFVTKKKFNSEISNESN